MPNYESIYNFSTRNFEIAIMFDVKNLASHTGGEKCDLNTRLFKAKKPII
jgi:hypothetical protein